MKNKDLEYKVIEGNKLGELLEMKLIIERLGLDSFISRYKKTQEGVELLSYAQDELDRHYSFSDILRETLDAENITDASDEEKEDMLYTEEFDSCGCCNCDYEDDDDFDDEDEVEGTYVVVYLEDEDFDDDEDYDWEDALDWESDTDLDWADEFDDFYADSFENSIFKEMEDFINEASADSKEEEEEEESTPDNFIISPEIFLILEGYFKKFLK